MRILCFTFGDADHGLGHFRRCEALAKVAIKRGCRFIFASNRIPHAGEWIKLHGVNDEDGFKWACNLVRPDCLVIDLEEKVPEFVWSYASEFSIKTCLLNGVGRLEGDEARADLAWVQDTGERVIIRPEVTSLVRAPSPSWLVFGGSADPLGLVPAFALACPHLPAYLVKTDLINYTLVPRWEHSLVTDDAGFLTALSTCGSACVHMGMITWELAYLGVPVYVFSRSIGHLEFAKNMERLGLIRAYPEVGLPAPQVLKSFLSVPYVPKGNRPDGLGAVRLIQALQELVNGQ